MKTEWSLKNQGDFLEKNVYEFVNEAIPAYELIWKKFIGHKGNGIMADMVTISSDVQEKRVHFAQNHYTILESLYFMKRIYQEESAALVAISDLETYRKAINQVVLFGAYLGRVVDCTQRSFEKVEDVAGAEKAKNRLMTLYETRHILIHGIKFPVKLDDGLFMVPAFSETEHGWHHASEWKQIAELDTKHLSERLEELFSALVKEISAILYSLLDSVNLFIEKHHLELKDPEIEYKPSSKFFGEISGSTEVFNVSTPPSCTTFVNSCATITSNSNIFIQPSGIAPIKPSKDFINDEN